MIVLAVVMGVVFVVPVFILTYRRYLLRCRGRWSPRRLPALPQPGIADAPPVIGQLPIADEVVHDSRSPEESVVPARLVRLPPSAVVSDLLARLGLVVQPPAQAVTAFLQQDPQLAALPLPTRRPQPQTTARDAHPLTAV
jgi:hypothetical protein